MSEKKVFKVGSRKSQLALIQTEYVIEKLKEKFPDVEFEIVTMITTGDKILDKPLPKIGEKSLFTKELEVALKENEVDFVVHSLKDLPTTLPAGLTIGAVLEREDPRDVLILSKEKAALYKNLKNLPSSSIIGTSSLRRCAQLSRNYPNITVKNIRGNLNTRFKKLDDDGDDNKYCGIILAAAGVKRMKMEHRITQILEPSDFLYAVGQGALAVECSSKNDIVLDLLKILNDEPTVICVVAERSFLKTLGGGCSAPVAVYSNIEGKILTVVGAVWSLDGSKFLKGSQNVTLTSDLVEPHFKIPHRELKPHVGITAKGILDEDLEAAEKLGIKLADELIKQGALSVINEAKLINEKHDALSVKTNDKNGSTSNIISELKVEENVVHNL